jgi:hypothetical protein
LPLITRRSQVQILAPLLKISRGYVKRMPPFFWLCPNCAKENLPSKHPCIPSSIPISDLFHPENDLSTDASAFQCGEGLGRVVKR